MSNTIFLSELLSTRLPYSCCHLNEQDNGGFQNLEQKKQKTLKNNVQNQKIHHGYQSM